MEQSNSRMHRHGMPAETNTPSKPTKSKEKVDVKFKQSNEKIFAFVKDEKDKIHICLGGYLVSEKTFDTFDQAQRYVGSKPWEIIINTCATILTHHEEVAKKAEKVK